MDLEEEIVSRKKLDEQKKKLQKELREIEKLSCLSKDVQEILKSNLQQQLQAVEQRKQHLMSEHQKVQKKTQKIQSTQDKRRNMQKESAAARKIREETDRNEERFRQLSDNVDQNKMVDAEMAAELQGLQAEERRGSNASQAVGFCMETRVEQFFAVGADQARFKFDAMCQVFFKKFEAYAPSAQIPGKERGRRNRRRTRARQSQSAVGVVSVKRVQLKAPSEEFGA